LCTYCDLTAGNVHVVLRIHYRHFDHIEASLGCQDSNLARRNEKSPPRPVAFMLDEGPVPA
jgi:hypothetical protein